MTDLDGFKRRDAEFLEGLRRGDDAVYAAIIEAYGPHARRLMRRVGAGSLSEEELDDAIQSVFIALWRSHDRSSPVWPYVKLVAERRAKDHLRSAARAFARRCTEASKVEGLLRTEPRADAGVISEELMELIAMAAHGLTEKESVAFWRRAHAANGENWADKLALSNGGTASGWRKAGCIAFGKVRDRLTGNPVVTAYLEKSA